MATVYVKKRGKIYGYDKAVYEKNKEKITQDGWTVCTDEEVKAYLKARGFEPVKKEKPKPAPEPTEPPTDQA